MRLNQKGISLVTLSIALVGASVFTIGVARLFKEVGRVQASVQDVLANRMGLVSATAALKRYVRLASACLRNTDGKGYHFMICSGAFFDPSRTDVVRFRVRNPRQVSGALEMAVLESATGIWKLQWQIPNVRLLTICGDVEMKDGKCFGNKLDRIHTQFLASAPERAGRFFRVVLEGAPTAIGAATPVISTSVFIRNSAANESGVFYEF